MVRHQAPTKQLYLALGHHIRKPPEKFFPVLFVSEDLLVLYTPSHHVLQNVWHIQSSASRHGDILNQLRAKVNVTCNSYPISFLLQKMLKNDAIISDYKKGPRFFLTSFFRMLCSKLKR